MYSHTTHCIINQGYQGYYEIYNNIKDIFDCGILLQRTEDKIVHLIVPYKNFTEDAMFG